MKKYDPHKDSDPQATLDWIESLDSIIKDEGIERAHYILERLIEYSRRHGVRLPYSPCTAYYNTIPLEQQEPFPFINQRVNPSTFHPASTSRAAVKELSTPPESPTAIE